MTVAPLPSLLAPPPLLRSRSDVAAPPWGEHTATAGPLRAVLDAVDARDLYGHVTSGALYARDVADARRRASEAGALESAVARLLFLGDPVDPATLPRALTPTVAALGRAGLLRSVGGLTATDGWVLAVAHRGYLIVGTPPNYPAAVSNASRAYLGVDSLILAGMVPRMVGRSMLDLGAGCGLHGLLVADGARRAVLTEIDGGALDIARLNAALNEVAHPLEFRLGDAYAPVAGERFDAIVTLAPYVPSVPDAHSSSVYAGGRDGLELLRRFIGGATDHLLPGGEFIAIAQLLCDRNGPLLAHELAGLAPDLDAYLTYDEWHPLQPYIVELATRLSAHGSPLSVRELVDQYADSLRPLGVTGVATTRIRLRKSAAPPAVAPRVRGRFIEISGDDVFALAPDTALEREQPVPLLSSSSGGVNPIDGATADLLECLDGTRTLAEAVTAAWGTAAPALHTDLVDQAIRRVRDLASAGLTVRIDRVREVRT